MRAYKRYAKRGFTLVELMIVIAIIGVLAALAIYGVRRYLASAKTSEGKNTVGAIARAAKQSFERETAVSELIATGKGETTAANHTLCDSATPVPNTAPPPGKKYQPETGNGLDYDSGDATKGWRCLKFVMTQAHYYKYHYTKAGGSPVTVAHGGTAVAAGAESFEAAAEGDLDDDTVTSAFALVGQSDGAKEMRISTQVFIDKEFE